MVMTLDNIRAVTVGALAVEERQDGYHFRRFTEKQLAAWSTYGWRFSARAEATCGVRLDFVTDARALCFSAAAGNYELHIDGLLRSKHLLDADGRVECPLSDPLGNGKDEYRVSLYLPSHTTGVLRDVTLEGASYVRPCEYDCRLLMIGDSITQGWESEYDSMTYAYALSRALRANSLIQGVGGSYYDEKILDRLPFDPDVVTVAYGVNDYDVRPSIDELRAHTSAFLDGIASLYAGKKIFVLSPIFRGQRNSQMGRFEDCRAVIIEEAERRGMIHIDGLSLVPPIPALYADGYLHPNALGFAYYAENVVREIRAHL